VSKRNRRRSRNRKKGIDKLMTPRVSVPQSKHFSTTSIVSCRIATTISHLVELAKTSPEKLAAIKNNLEDGNISGFFVLCDVAKNANIEKIKANIEKSAQTQKHGWAFNRIIYPSYGVLDESREHFIYRILNGFAIDAFFDSSPVTNTLVSSLRIRALQVKSNNNDVSDRSFEDWVFRLNKYTARIRQPEEIKQIG